MGTPPDLVFTITDGTQNYGRSCEDKNPCIFSTALKIPSVDRFDFTLERLKFSVGDTDVASDDGCFSGILPLVDRDLKPHTLKFSGGTVTIRLLPAGK